MSPDSISETVKLTGIGKTTVNRMRAAWTELHNGQYGDVKELREMSGGRQQVQGNGTQAFDEDSWLQSRRRLGG